MAVFKESLPHKILETCWQWCWTGITSPHSHNVENRDSKIFKSMKVGVKFNGIIFIPSLIKIHYPIQNYYVYPDTDMMIP